MFLISITSRIISILNETSEQLKCPKISSLGVSIMAVRPHPGLARNWSFPQI